ncbi:unnamed protein product [Linum trigynum]|uniref:Uncharacterized protein n=1 Tax=Linum trigynum TaxID=586398 RepID=A0AAV2DK33_9ROSI
MEDETQHKSTQQLTSSFLHLRRRITAYRTYQLGSKIEAEIQVYFDREQIQKLARTLQLTEGEEEGEEAEEEKIRLLEEFEERLGTGFDSEL